MHTDLLEIVGRFPARRIVLVGDYMLDRYIYGDAERISPEAPVPVLRVVERSDLVGGAGSVALNILSLGASVQCFGLLGHDPFGERVHDFLGQAGADTSGLIRVDDRPTITKTRLVGLAEHRHRQQILRVDDELVRPPSEKDTRTVLDKVCAVIPDCDVVCLEDYAKGMLSAEICATIIKTAREHNKPVFVDPMRGGRWEKYAWATLLTPNRAELEQGIGKRIGDEELHGESMGLIRRLQLDALVVTLGRDGAMLVYNNDTSRRFPTRPRAVYDNTGAGDAVLAMMAVAVAAGATLEQAVPLSNVAGGLEVSKFGCVPISRDEVLQELHRGHEATRGKLRTLDELLPEIDARRHRGETVVFTNGCFDLLHPGHVELLEKAKSLGSVLVVGLNSDDSVRSLGKGGDRPIRRQPARARVLAALEVVDYVVIFDEPDPRRTIERLSPDVLVKGADWAGKEVIGQRHVESRGGRVELVELVDGFSTTAELERIRSIPETT